MPTFPEHLACLIVPTKMISTPAASITLKIIGAILSVLGLYGLTAACLIPWYLQFVVLPEWASHNQMSITVESFAINPFLLKASLKNVELHRVSAVKHASLMSFRDFTLTVDPLQSVRLKNVQMNMALSGLSVHLERTRDGFIGLPVPTSQKPDSKPDTGFSYPVTVQQWILTDSHFDYLDNTLQDPLHLRLQDISARLEYLNLQAPVNTHFELAMSTENGEHIHTDGTLQITPFKVDGHLVAKGLHWAPWGNRYARSSSLQWLEGTLNMAAQYRFERSPSPHLQIQLDGDAEKLALAINENQKLTLAKLALQRASYHFPNNDLSIGLLTLSDLETKSAALKIGKQQAPDAIKTVRMADIQYQHESHALSIGKLQSERSNLHLGLTESGKFQISGLVSNPTQSPDKTTTDTVSSTGQPGLNFTIDELELNQYSVGFNDESRIPPVKLKMDPIALRLQNLSNHSERPVKLDFSMGVGKKGVIRSVGQGGLVPLTLDARVDVENVRLQPIQQYWDDWVGFSIVTGRLNLKGDLVINSGKSGNGFSGDIEVTRLKTVDKLEKKDFIQWESLRLDGLVVDAHPKRVSLRSATLRSPFARVVIGSDGGLNIGRQFLARSDTPSVESAEKQPDTQTNWPIVVGSVLVSEGSMNFSDASLKPNFITDIKSLNGSIRGLSSQSQAKADVNVKGNLNNSSPVSITGQFNPFQSDHYTDMTMTFKDVNLTNLSPYSGKFAGYRIEKGKLDLNLHYKIAQRKLKAENRMILNQLVLGERVESPEATTLPIRWALALLKDSEGRIDINLPISGRLDDPHFSIRNVLGEAFTQTFTKLISSPFSVLGHLLPEEGEELAWIGFQPGDTQLTQSATSKLEKIADILKQRPGVNLDIKSLADRQQDRKALAERELYERIENLRWMELEDRHTREKLDDEAYHRLFTEFVRNTDLVSPALRKLSGADPAILTGKLFEDTLEKVLMDWPVDDLALRQLAQQRSESIRHYMIHTIGLPDSRIFLLDVKINDQNEGDVKSLLSLSTAS